MNIDVFNKLKSKFYEKFPDSDIEILKPLDNWSNVLVKTKYGVCKPSIHHLLNGKIPSIRSALNKQEYFINKAKEIHGDKYDYSITNFKNSLTNIIYICKNHSIISQAPGCHLAGKGCDKCKYKILSIKNSENNSGGYSLTNWKIKAEKSKNFDSFKVYILKIWNDDGCFYKIGRTFLSVYDRFKSLKQYRYEIVKIIEGEVDYIYNLENELKTKHKQFKYVPKINFHGRHECFTKVNLENDTL